MQINKLILLLLSLFICGCGDSNKDSNTDKIVVGTSPDMPPFEFIRTDSNKSEVIGFDIDLINSIAKEMNLEIQIKTLDFNSLIPALKSGRVDMIISSMNDTEQRRNSIDFSNSYLSIGISALTKQKYISFSNNSFKGKVIGVQLGTSHEQFVKNLAQETDDFKIISLNHLGELVQEMLSGRIDIVVLDNNAGVEFVKIHNSLYIYEIPDSEIQYAIAFNKNSHFIDGVNLAISNLINSGYIDTLKQKWLSNK